MFNNIILLNLLYYFDTTTQLLLLKIFSVVYNINNVIIIAFIKSLLLPYLVYKLYRNYQDPKIYDLLCGLFDYLELVITFIGFAGLTFGEYVVLRTSTVFFNAIMLYLHNKKILSIYKYIGITFIFIACCILIGFYGISRIQYSLPCLIGTILYAYNGFIIETFVKEKELNFYWTKTISSIIGCLVFITTQHEYNVINFVFNYDKIKIIIVVSLSFVITFTEIFYYYLKVKIIDNYENGSIIINFIDIFRRFTLLICGIIFFKEKYDFIIYISFSFMIIGSLIGLINKKNYVLFN